MQLYRAYHLNLSDSIILMTTIKANCRTFELVTDIIQRTKPTDSWLQPMFRRLHAVQSPGARFSHWLVGFGHVVTRRQQLNCVAACRAITSTEHNHVMGGRRTTARRRQCRSWRHRRMALHYMLDFADTAIFNSVHELQSLSSCSPVNLNRVSSSNVRLLNYGLCT